MKSLKVALPLALLALLTMILSACASEQYYQSGSENKQTTTQYQDNKKQDEKKPEYQYYVKAASYEAKGHKTYVLTTYEGYTLYYFTDDTPSAPKCTDSCAQTWKPYVYNGSEKITYSSEITGKVDLYKASYGHHVTYNGHYLYTYTGDSAPNQYNGEGVGNKWYTATVDLKPY
jgi:predicted lipoprotein with Yx(FWY)xxD motif